MILISKETDILHRYQNGDFHFTLHTDGTLIRESEVPNPVAAHPSSIDVKITDYCDMGCQYCHESSTRKGLHGDLNVLIQVLDADCFPSGVELAIGGGNPLSHPDLIPFLEQLKVRGFVANITVNQGHVACSRNLLDQIIRADLVKGIGVSIINDNLSGLHHITGIAKHLVYHVIAGVHHPNIVSKLTDFHSANILVLGYKKFGFGASFMNDQTQYLIGKWRTALLSMLGKFNLSFDNLAIEQLGVERILTREAWDKLYMGDDFTTTMYIDAVRQEFAPTSRSDKRKSFNNVTLLNFFEGRDERVNL
jgi:Radical SAM superfamily